MSQPAVFVDRDGVLAHAVLRDGKPGTARTTAELQIIEGSAEAVARLKAHGFQVFVVSNQPDVARGLLPAESLADMTARLYATLDVDDVLTCEHDEHHRCACRKPLPGMLHTLAERWDVDLTASYMVGDTWRDLAAGAAAGCTTLLVRSPFTAAESAIIEVPDLPAAVNRIIELEEQNEVGN